VGGRARAKPTLNNIEFERTAVAKKQGKNTGKKGRVLAPKMKKIERGGGQRSACNGGRWGGKPTYKQQPERETLQCERKKWEIQEDKPELIVVLGHSKC